MARSGSGKRKKKGGGDGTPEITNRRARYDYAISDTLECGIALVGSEVKAIREGHCSIAEGFARIDDETGELWLHGIHIGEYAPARGSVSAHDPHRKRKLLAHRNEIRRLEAATRPKGTTLVPLKLYFKDGWAKILLGVGEGKRKADKREDSKQREADREIRRAMSRGRVG